MSNSGKHKIQPNTSAEVTDAKKGNAMPAAGCANAIMPNTIMTIAMAYPPFPVAIAVNQAELI
ncbi:hypothetical protein [Nostoc sp.]|uniref:hypothetical protein n=1 Tax=Nostoc sp. TaxID=1180 RepID=UPI002FF734B6